ncbi:MAG: Dihydrodipicolinate reductase [uncultured bacterium]|nr:MAG: Dihydrodipicolinate reductase [uncultured bacterium]
MTIRILVNGAFGKMGQLTAKTINNNPELILAGQTGRDHHLAAEIKQTGAQVVIDFTHADAVLQNLQTIIDAGAHPVIGTSGLMKEQVAPLQTRCAQLKLGGVIAPNFSLGAILMMKYAQEIATYFPYVEIIEMHHADKLDSPSGTAVRTAELLSATRSLPKTSIKQSKEVIPGARGANYQDIAIHAVRLPGLVAHQQIIFGGTGETLTLRHDAIDRECFMPGIILACKKVMHLNQLVYGLEHIL